MVSRLGPLIDLTFVAVWPASPDAGKLLAAISTGVFIISDAGTASSSGFHGALEGVDHHARIRTHDAVETVTT
jgi:hypothetical protein